MDLFLVANICEDPNVLKAIRLIQVLIKLVSVALPIVIIIIATVDIGKSVITEDTKAISNKYITAFKRLVLAVLVFFAPSIVNGFAALLENGSSNITKSYNSCLTNTSNIEYYEKLYEERMKKEDEELKASQKYVKKTAEKAQTEAQESTKTNSSNSNTSSASQANMVAVLTGASAPANILSANAKTKLNYLFPGGVPSTPLAMQMYLTKIQVPLTKKDGTKTTGELIIHKSLARDVQEVFKIAQDSGFKIYSASCYQFRSMNNGKGSGQLSHHSYGIAIDINPNENYSHRGSKVIEGKFWDPSRSEFSIPKDGVLVQAFKAKGWKWAGDWPGSYQDYMHFSFTGN